ncbi:MAG: cupredoxin domain-containing protein [Streptosporangiaceae bacterium]
MFRTRVIVPVLALALAAACGGEAEEAPSAASSASVSSSASTSAPPSATPASDAVEIKVTVTGGKVAPRPSIHKVRKGQTVRITVTSDKADQLHVHGYDKEKELPAGATATVEFKADQTGRFEVETHEQGLQLFQLEVS